MLFNKVITLTSPFYTFSVTRGGNGPSVHMMSWCSGSCAAARWSVSSVWEKLQWLCVLSCSWGASPNWRYRSGGGGRREKRELLLVLLCTIVIIMVIIM